MLFAQKTGLLDLSTEKSAKDIPDEALQYQLKLINVSGTRIKALRVCNDVAKLQRILGQDAKLSGAQPSLLHCSALKELTVPGNDLTALPELPPTLVTLNASRNPRLSASSFPLPAPQASRLTCLLILDLSATGLTQLTGEILLLAALQELKLDGNRLTTLEIMPPFFSPETHPRDWPALTELKHMTVAGNAIQPLPGVIPQSLLESTQIVGLNLAGNPGLSVNWLVHLPGYPSFEARRARSRSKGLTGDGGVYGMQDGKTCGLG